MIWGMWACTVVSDPLSRKQIADFTQEGIQNIKCFTCPSQAFFDLQPRISRPKTIQKRRFFACPSQLLFELWNRRSRSKRCPKKHVFCVSVAFFEVSPPGTPPKKHVFCLCVAFFEPQTSKSQISPKKNAYKKARFWCVCHTRFHQNRRSRPKTL